MFFPKELMEANRWALWQQQFKDNKKTKIPINATNLRNARVNVDTDWTSFESAEKVLKTFDNYNGLTFLLGDGIVGIDLDYAYDDNNGLKSWAWEILQKFRNAYIEKSQSGKGIHILCKADPFKGGKGTDIKAIEAYCHHRAFVMTGEHMQWTPSLANCNEEVKWLLEQYKGDSMPENVLLLKLSDRPKFNECYRGEYDSQIYSKSDVDFALSGFLIRETNNAPLILKIIKRSGLWREKWERKDYQEMTIGEIAKREGKVLQWTEEIVEPTYVVEPDFFESNFIKKFQDEYNIKNARGIGLSKFNGIKWSQDDAIYQWSYDFDAYVKQQSVKSAKPDNFIQKWSKLSKVNSVEKFLDKNTIMPNITHDGINTDKGYIPFDTGKIRPAVPEDCFIQHARKGDSQSVVGEVSPWEKFIMEIFPDKEEANYLQRVLGSCLSLSTRDQLIWLFIGQGGNGKSVLMNVIEYVLNDYAVRLPIGFFEKRSCVDTSRGMASLIGKRLAYTTEIPNYINEDLLKEIAGGDTVVGRYLYHESFNFDTSAKIIMLGNIIPRLIDYSDGLKRRLMIIPFKQNFIKKPNLNIAQELKEDTNSVFNWLWVGYLNWLALGVRQGIPKSFMLASLEAHHINDSVEQFIEDCLEKSEDMYILVKDLYPLYLDWVQPEKGMGRNNFWRALHAKGITQEVKNIDGKTFKVVKNFTFKNMFKNA